ncbi:MAG: hypothetical protein COA94_01170 [Rickettsiales bacterium]|nr:MAG: hypothetical protein COA94_01170 [Rickettsiales bacterium]
MSRQVHQLRGRSGMPLHYFFSPQEIVKIWFSGNPEEQKTIKECLFSKKDTSNIGHYRDQEEAKARGIFAQQCIAQSRVVSSQPNVVSSKIEKVTTNLFRFLYVDDEVPLEEDREFLEKRLSVFTQIYGRSVGADKTQYAKVINGLIKLLLIHPRNNNKDFVDLLVKGAKCLVDIDKLMLISMLNELATLYLTQLDHAGAVVFAKVAYTLSGDFDVTIVKGNGDVIDVTIDKGNAAYNFALALKYIKPHKSLKLLKEALIFLPEDADVKNEIAIVTQILQGNEEVLFSMPVNVVDNIEGQGFWQKALYAVYDLMQNKDSSNRFILYNLTVILKILYKNEDWEQAQKFIEIYLVNLPNPAEDHSFIILLYYEYLVYEMNGESDSASAIMERMSSFPKIAESVADRANILHGVKSESGHDYVSALEYFEKIKHAATKNCYVAACEVKRGEYSEELTQEYHKKQQECYEQQRAAVLAESILGTTIQEESPSWLVGEASYHASQDNVILIETACHLPDYYAVISPKLELDEVSYAQYLSALQGGVVTHSNGQNGIKTLRKKVLEIKIAADSRLVTSCKYQNDAEEVLVVFDHICKNHEALQRYINKSKGITTQMVPSAIPLDLDSLDLGLDFRGELPRPDEDELKMPPPAVVQENPEDAVVVAIGDSEQPT